MNEPSSFNGVMEFLCPVGYYQKFIPSRPVASRMESRVQKCGNRIKDEVIKISCRTRIH